MTAPGRLPIPPTTITVKARSSSGRPILESSELYAKARSTPARPPRPDEMKKVAAIARSTSIPRMRAARGFSASARISRPRAVPRTRYVSTSMSAIERPMIARRTPSSVAPPTWMRNDGTVPAGNVMKSPP